LPTTRRYLHWVDDDAGVLVDPEDEHVVIESA
jgi:hypothetical protein